MKKLYVGILALCVLTGANHAKATAKKHFCSALAAKYNLIHAGTTSKAPEAYKRLQEAEKTLQSNKLLYGIYKDTISFMKAIHPLQDLVSTSDFSIIGGIPKRNQAIMSDIKTLIQISCPSYSCSKDGTIINQHTH